MPAKVEVGRGDVRAQTLACLGVGLALIAALGMLLHGAWFLAAACLFALGVVFAVVGSWAADRKARRGGFRRPGEHGA